MKEGEWLVGLLGELGVKVSPYTLMCDSNSAIALIKNPIVSARSKHIELKYHFIRDYAEAKKMMVEYVPSEDNWADCFTKALPTTKLYPLCSRFLCIPKRVKDSDEPVEKKFKAQ